MRKILLKMRLIFDGAHYTWVQEIMQLFRRISPSTPSIPTVTFSKATKLNMGNMIFGLALCNST